MTTTYKKERLEKSEFEIGIRANSFSSQKKSIVLVHGIGTSSDYYLPLIEQLSSSYNVFALDLPGYGKTAKPKKPLTINELADVTLEYLQNHQPKSVVLVGHSMGGQVVSRVTKINPEQVHKLILLSPTVNRKERSVIQQGLRLMQDTFLEPPKVTAIIFLNYARMGVIRFLKTSKYMVQSRIEASLANTNTECLIIRGEKDFIVPRAWVLHLESLSPSISAKEVPKAPHAFHYMYANEVKELCQAFIEK